MGLALGTNLKFYTSVTKGLKLNVKKFWELILTFVEVTGKKLVRGAFLGSLILNRVNILMKRNYSIQGTIKKLVNTIFPISLVEVN